MSDDHDGPDALDRLEVAAENVAVRAEWERANRVGLLWVHALVGIWVGVQILLFGGPSNIEALVGVWSRPALGVLGVLGGLVLAVGITRRTRRRRHWLEFEAIGLGLLGLWDLCMTVGMAAARMQGGAFNVRPLFEPLPEGYVLPYPIGVYAGLTALICVHLWTLRRFKKGQ